MIPGTIFDIFQPMNDFFYGLDVEIRPKLTRRRYTGTVQYRSWAARPCIRFGPLLLSTRGGEIGINVL